MSEWYVMSEQTSPYRKKRVEIKAWEPGDGLHCSSKNMARRLPCTAPVAVVRTIEPNSRGMQYPLEVRTRVVCRSHLAGMAGKAPLGADVEKRAREAVLAAHWDEYQAEIVKQRGIAEQTRLASLPDFLREAAEGADDAGK